MAARFRQVKRRSNSRRGMSTPSHANGIDAGSNIGDALRLLQSEGHAVSSRSHTARSTRRRIPDQAEKEAAGFKIEIGRPLTTFAEMMSSAMLLDRSISRFASAAGSTTWTPMVVPRRVRAGNHAVCGGLARRKCGTGSLGVSVAQLLDVGIEDGG